jgi:hypothetical protein
MKPASTTILQGKMERKLDNRPPNNSSFQSLVKDHFQYLVDEFGFHLIEDWTYYAERSVGGKYEFLRYESDRVFVQIGYSSYEYELYLSFGIKEKEEKDEISYTLQEVVALAEAKYLDLTSKKRSDFPEVFPQMAVLFKKYANQGILGDPEYYKQIAVIREKQSCQWAVGRAERIIGKDVIKAWKKEDFGEVIRLCERFEEDLTDDLKQKLEYARAQLRDDPVTNPSPPTKVINKKTTLKRPGFMPPGNLFRRKG